MVLLLRTFLSFERKNPSGARFAVRLPHLYQNLLIARDLQIKPLAIFFLCPLQLQVLTAFLRRAGVCQVLVLALCKNQKSSIWMHPFYIMPDIQ